MKVLKRVCSWIFCWAVFQSNGSFAPAQQNKHLDRIYADWHARAARSSSVLYRLSGSLVLSAGSRDQYDPRVKRAAPVNPPRDITCTIQRTILLDLANKRHRIDVAEEEYDDKTDRNYPRTIAQLFDGKATKQWRPRALNTHPRTGLRPTDAELGIGVGHIGVGFSIDPNHWPAFLGHGIIPCRSAPILPGELRAEPDRELITVYGQGVHRSRPCLILRTRPQADGFSFEEYWVDLAYESSVLRLIYVLYDTPLFDFDITYEQTAHGWLPKHWSYTNWNPNTKSVTRTERIQVDELRLGPEITDEVFEIEQRPNMLVERIEHHQAGHGKGWWEAPEATGTMYEVGPDGSTNEVVIRDGIVRKRGYRWWWLIGALVAIVMLGGAIFLAVRRARKVINRRSVV